MKITDVGHLLPIQIVIVPYFMKNPMNYRKIFGLG